MVSRRLKAFGSSSEASGPLAEAGAAEKKTPNSDWADDHTRTASGESLQALDTSAWCSANGRPRAKTARSRPASAGSGTNRSTSHPEAMTR